LTRTIIETQGLLDLRFVGSTTNIKSWRAIHPSASNNIHGGHGQTSSFTMHPMDESNQWLIVLGSFPLHGDLPESNRVGQELL
jgi:hypothetical protein